MRSIYLILIFLLIGMSLYFYFQKEDLPTNIPTIQASPNAIKKENIVEEPVTKEGSIKKEPKIQNETQIADKNDNGQKIIISYYQEKMEEINNINYLDKEEPTYQEHDNIYLNRDGKIEKITEEKGKYYMPSLSSDGNYLAFNEISKGIFVKNLIDGSIKNIGVGNNVYWHPNRDIFLFEISKDDGHNIIESDIYLYDMVNNKKINLTNTPNIIEEKAIFSEDGEYIYCKNRKTGKIIQIKLKDGK